MILKLFAERKGTRGRGKPRESQGGCHNLDMHTELAVEIGRKDRLLILAILQKSE